MAARPKWMAVQAAAILAGAVLLLFGIAGFVPGLTSHVDQMEWAGPATGAKLFGIFAVSGLHNALHLAFGVIGVLFARTYAASRAFLLLGGLAFLALWGYGLVIDHGSGANIVPVTAANNWLHLGTGAIMVLLGVTLGAQHDPTKPRRKFKARTG